MGFKLQSHIVPLKQQLYLIEMMIKTNSYCFKYSHIYFLEYIVDIREDFTYSKYMQLLFFVPNMFLV